jgi:hypothetical protein
MKTTGWAVMTGRGAIMFALTRPTRREALAAFEANFSTPWRKRRVCGWRCVPVAITTRRRSAQ